MASPWTSSTTKRSSSGTSKISFSYTNGNALICTTSWYHLNNRCSRFRPFGFYSSILPGLRTCATDDDVAMHLIKHTEDFEKYLHYMVGEAQAEACISDKPVQQYFQVFTSAHICFYQLLNYCSFSVVFNSFLYFVVKNILGNTRIWEVWCSSHGCSQFSSATIGEDSNLPGFTEGLYSARLYWTFFV